MFKNEKTNRWLTVIACFVMVMVALGFAGPIKTLFPDEIAKALGVERSLVSVGESCRYIATAVVNIFFGMLIAKFGPKKLVFAGFVSLIASMLAYWAADNLFMIYLGGTLLGGGLSCKNTKMVGYIIGMWCKENKGTIMGAVLASNGLGGAVAIQIVGGLINPDEVGSYHGAYLVLAVIFAVAAVVVLLLMREKPKEENTASAPAKKKKRGQEWEGIDFRTALRKWYFWGILACIFFSGMVLQGTHGIVAMHYKDVGIDYGAVKGLLSFGSILLASAKFLTGFIYDRTGLRVTSGICIFISVVSSFLLAVIKGDSVGFILALIYTVISQYAMPLETIMLPIYANDLFGNKSYSQVLGLFVSVNTAGYAVGAPIMNLCYDIFGSYAPSLFLVGGIMAVMLILSQFVITAAHRDKLKIEAKAEEITPA